MLLLLPMRQLMLALLVVLLFLVQQLRVKYMVLLRQQHMGVRCVLVLVLLVDQVRVVQVMQSAPLFQQVLWEGAAGHAAHASCTAALPAD